MFEKLNLPQYNLQLKRSEGKVYVFDSIRRKDIVLQPEEWVRQHFIHYMMNDLGYPKGLISVETVVKQFGHSYRADIVAYDKSGKPVLIVECKATFVKIQQAVFDQIANYNMKLKVPYLVVSNGLNHFCCKVDIEKKEYLFLKELPPFSALQG